MINTSKGNKLILRSILGAILLGMIIVFGFNHVYVSAEEDKKEETSEDWIHYEGVATGKVNVRTGPGEEYDKLTDINGNNIKLNAQEEVIILEDCTAKTGKVWYKISFTRDGHEYEGFSTSSYISKDLEKPITPTPEPTPEPTPTPTSTPTPTPTVEITPTPEPLLPDNSASGNSKATLKKVIIAVIVVAVVFVCSLVAYSILKRRNSKSSSSASRKVDRLKKLNVENSTSGKKVPRIRTVENIPNISEEVKQEIYIKKNIDFSDEFIGHEDINSKENQEKKALREAIDRLQQHDIVIHKIYGEGEVYDNSDVKLIEVRFGSDMRFLKKDQLVSRKELTIVDEEDQTLARRRNNRRKRTHDDI